MTSTRSRSGVRRPTVQRPPAAGLFLWLACVACVAGAVALVALGARTLAALPQGAPTGGKIVAMRQPRQVGHGR